MSVYNGYEYVDEYIGLLFLNKNWNPTNQHNIVVDNDIK